MVTVVTVLFLMAKLVRPLGIPKRSKSPETVLMSYRIQLPLFRKKLHVRTENKWRFNKDHSPIADVKQKGEAPVSKHWSVLGCQDSEFEDPASFRKFPFKFGLRTWVESSFVRNRIGITRTKYRCWTLQVCLGQLPYGLHKSSFGIDFACTLNIVKVTIFCALHPILKFFNSIRKVFFPQMAVSLSHGKGRVPHKLFYRI